eukprot:12529081-Heterocapsa_arctica.AAC.1
MRSSIFAVAEAMPKCSWRTGGGGKMIRELSGSLSSGSAGSSRGGSRTAAGSRGCSAGSSAG